MEGGKDHFYIYDENGVLLHHLPPNGDVPTNLSTDEGYDAVKAILVEALEN